MSIALSESQTALLTRCIETLNSPDFGSQLTALIHSVVAFDSAVMMAYPDDSTLAVLLDELAAGDRAVFDGPYRNGLYMLSPLYRESRNGRRGCFHISEIAPEGFTQSEFYELYYSRNDSIDQAAYLMETGQGTPVALSIERTIKLEPFTAADLKQLSALAPLLAALVGQQQWNEELVPPASVQPDMHAHLQLVLENFGCSTLTPRERQVVRLILRGYPSKSVARELDISTQTEQVHRKNIYQKLTISSHAELFSLFFDSIALPSAANEDPLLTLRAT
jgi:DNA-binding CsgD family transcriptional regulator